MPIDPDKLAQFRHLRRHGANLETAARKADLALDEAHKAEGRFYCPRLDPLMGRTCLAASAHIGTMRRYNPQQI